MGRDRRIGTDRREHDATPSRVSGFLSAICLAVFIPAVFMPAAPASSQAPPGFDFCAPPFRPPCVSDPSNKTSADACDREVKAYIATVFRYRECLDTESQRAVRESNDVIDHWRCRQSGERCRR